MYNGIFYSSLVDFSPRSINLRFRKTLTLGLVHCATLSLSLNNEITKQRWIVYRDQNQIGTHGVPIAFVLRIKDLGAVHKLRGGGGQKSSKSSKSCLRSLCMAP